jgi:serine/threonine-protein kinase
MATIFLARMGGAGGFQRFVAIKRLHPHLAHEADFVEMFLDEARLAASIHHPNVVPILEVGESPAGYYLVMEYIEGDTLWNLRNMVTETKPGGKLPLPTAVRIIHEALLGLHAAHELVDEAGQPLNVVHRDVSPQNILVGIDGTARLTDFGVARAATRLSSTRSGEVKGKMAYMAPEQVRGEEIDRRSDLFAMGIVLWEVLANKHLFLGPSEVATMHRVLNEPVPDLYTTVQGLPKRLADLVAKSLERDPTKRFATALEMAEAIEAATRGVMPLPQAREVAAVVDTLVGQRLADRKEAINRWLAGSHPTATGAWSALPPSVASQMLTPSSRRMPLPASPPGPPSSRPLPPPAPVNSLSTGSSLSPFLAASSSTTPPPPLSPEALAPPAPPRNRALFVVAPAVVLLGLGLGWVALRGGSSTPETSPAGSRSATPLPAASPAASAAPPAAPAASPVADPSATTSPPEPSVSAAPPPPTATARPRPVKTATTAAPTPTSTGLDNSPYR